MTTEELKAAVTDRFGPLQDLSLSQISVGNHGLCTNCGEWCMGVEPDARNYRCETCGEDEVFGLEDVILRFVDFEESA
jgi:hypothetical protein